MGNLQHPQYLVIFPSMQGFIKFVAKTAFEQKTDGEPNFFNNRWERWTRKNSNLLLSRSFIDPPLNKDQIEKLTPNERSQHLCLQIQKKIKAEYEPHLRPAKDLFFIEEVNYP